MGNFILQCHYFLMLAFHLITCIRKVNVFLRTCVWKDWCCYVKYILPGNKWINFYNFTAILYVGVGNVLTFERSQFKMGHDNIRLDKEWDEGMWVWSNVQGCEWPYTTLFTGFTWVSFIVNGERTHFRYNIAFFRYSIFM